MSRAFVKDDDDRPEAALPRVASEQPNYVTESGLRALREELARARREENARDVAYFEERLARAIPIDARHGDGEVVIGSTVATRDDRGAVLRVRIVGEDEADPRRGSLAWSSPFAQALLGHRLGESVIVHRPAGATTVTIEAIE